MPVVVYDAHLDLYLADALIPHRRRLPQDLGLQQIVRIEKDNEFATRKRKPGLICAYLATVIPKYRYNSRSIGLNDLTRLIRRAVIHDNDFQIRPIDSERAVNRRGQKGRVIVIRNDDRCGSSALEVSFFWHNRQDCPIVAVDRLVPQCQCFFGISA